MRKTRRIRAGSHSGRGRLDLGAAVSDDGGSTVALLQAVGTPISESDFPHGLTVPFRQATLTPANIAWKVAFQRQTLYSP